MEEQENLQKKAHTSFGKQILAKEKTAPVFSIYLFLNELNH
jgi:hypothetical protein